MEGVKMKTVFAIVSDERILRGKNGALLVFSSIVEAEQYAVAYVGGDWKVFMF